MSSSGLCPRAASRLAARLLTYLNPLYLELLTGLFLMANLPLIFRPATEPEVIKPLPKFPLSLVGLGAGFVSGMTGAAGPLFNRFYLRYGMQKEEIVASPRPGESSTGAAHQPKPVAAVADQD